MTATKKVLPEYWTTYESSFQSGLPKEIDKTSFVVLDTETTGFSFKNDRILSIGALRIINGSIKAKDAFEVFLEQDTFKKNTVEIHGIIKEGKIARIPEVEGLKKLLELSCNAIIIAHHTAFDIGMLNHALKRNGLPKLKNKTLDTAILYKKALPKSEQKSEGNHSLDELADKYGIPKTDRHTALGDAYITAISFLHIIEKLKPASTKALLKRNRSWWF